MIMGRKNPIADGTVTRPEVTSFADLEALKSAIIFLIAGSRAAVSIATQLLRSLRKRQSPLARCTMETVAAAIQIRNKRIPQRLGKLIALRTKPPEAREPPAAEVLIKGSTATDTSAANQTAKRVPEFCRGKRRNIIHAKSAISSPSGSEFKICPTAIGAMLCS
jgi:hypothetical protein